MASGWGAGALPQCSLVAGLSPCSLLGALCHDPKLPRKNKKMGSRAKAKAKAADVEAKAPEPKPLEPPEPLLAHGKWVGSADEWDALPQELRGQALPRVQLVKGMTTKSFFSKGEAKSEKPKLVEILELHGDGDIAIAKIRLPWDEIQEVHVSWVIVPPSRPPAISQLVFRGSFDGNSWEPRLGII